MKLSVSRKLSKIPEARKEMFDWPTALIASVPLIAIIGILTYFVKNPEKVEKWSSLIAKGISWAGSRWENASVAKDIQADINGFVRKTNAGMKSSILPYGVKVSWISSTSREAFVKEGKVIVKMQKHQNQAKNFLYALMEWTHKGLLPESRHLMNATVLRSIDFAFINKVLSETNRHDSRQLFIDEFYESEVPKGSLIEKYCTAFNKLDYMGMFTGVVLPEYSLLGHHVGSSLPNEETKLETIGFATMLERLSRKVSGKDVSPNYMGKNIKCSIVLIAKVEKYFEQGLSPYLSFINKCCEQGYGSIYVVGTGAENISIVEKIRDAYEQSKKISFVWEKTQTLKNNESKVLFFKTSALEQHV